MIEFLLQDSEEHTAGATFIGFADIQAFREWVHKVGGCTVIPGKTILCPMTLVVNHGK